MSFNVYRAKSLRGLSYELALQFHAPSRKDCMRSADTKMLFKAWMSHPKIVDLPPQTSVALQVTLPDKVSNIFYILDLKQLHSTDNFRGATGGLKWTLFMNIRNQIMEQPLMVPSLLRMMRSKSMGWKIIHSTWPSALLLDALISGAENISDYFGNKNQIKLAEKAAMSNLEFVYSALSVLGYAEKLEYQKIYLSVESVKALEEELKTRIDQYVGNKNQMKLAEKVGISNLGSMYSALSALGYAEILKYQLIGLPVKSVRALEEELKTRIDQYVGDENQMKLAKKVGISHLGSMYAALSALGYADKLEYQIISPSAESVKALEEELKNNLHQYIGNRNQMKLAEKVGISNLGIMYSALSALGYADKLEYQIIKLPVESVKALEEELKTRTDQYVGNKNQVKLAEKVGISHLGSMHSALSALGYAERLGYQKIELPVESVKALEAELKTDLDKYIGDKNQVKLAEKVGIFHLGKMYTALSALGYVDKLKYQKIELPVNSIKGIFAGMIELKNTGRITVEILVDRLQNKTREEAKEEFQKILEECA